MDEQQNRWKSPIMWIGLAGCVAQGICSVLMAAGVLSSEIAAAITGAFAGVLAFTTANNPCSKDKF